MKLPINLAVAPIVLGVISRANAAATVQPSNAYSGLSQQGISSFFGYPEKLVYIDDNSFLQVSQDGGSNWKTAIEDTNVAWVVTHPYDGLIGYVCDKEKSSLYLTQDSGRSFYELENCPQNIEGLRLSTIDPSYLMISSEGPDSAKDESSQTFDYYATTNSLDSSSSLTLVMEAAQDCQWVRSLSTSNDLLQASSIICVKDEQLVITHDLGETIEYVQVDGEPLRNVVSLFQESNFVLAVTGADSEHQKDSTYNIITTSNWSTWSRAELSDDSKPTELTCLLPSTKNSAHLYIPAVTDNSDSGIFLTSDASGIHFSKRLEGVQKVVRAANKYFDDILVASFSSTASKISYDDGRTWNSIVTDCESDDVSDGYSSCKDLYFLLSDNSGSSLVSPSPGIIAGLASPQLPATEDSVHLYLSDDFGRTWNMVRYSSHHFTFINSGYTLVAAPKTDHITEIYYTHDFGTWNSIHLDVPTKVLSIKSLDSAGVIIEGSFNQDEVSTIKIDFHDQYERDCKKEDFQLTSVTRMASAGISDKNVEKDCIMGAKGSFYRLRFNTICQIIDDAEPYHTITHEFCTCVTADYECSGNSVYDFSSGECNPIISLEEFTDQCNKDPSSEYPSIYSKIPGNKCSIEKGVDIAASTRCDNVYTIQENVDNNDDSKVKAELHKFDGDIIDYFYPKTSDENPEDEVIIVRTNYEKVYITHDQGGEWKQILEDTSVISAIPNPYFPDIMYFFTPSDQIYYTTDRAKTFNHFKVPLSLSHSAVMPLSFSREDPHKVIFIGENGCDNPFSSKCTLSAYYSTDYGKSWDILENDVRECNWISGLTQKTDPNLILCDKLVDGGRKVDLIASKDFFSNKETIFENIVGFALENEFIIVAKVSFKLEKIERNRLICLWTLQRN